MRHPRLGDTAERRVADVWLLWEAFTLRDIFADREDAEDAAEALRARLATERLRTHAVQVRVERHEIIPKTDRPPVKGVPVRQAIADAAKEWPLLGGDEITTHFILVKHYLAVPYDGRLKFPALQFRPDLREQWPGFREALAVFRDNGWDDASIYLWFTGQGGMPDGGPPALILPTNPAAVRSRAQRQRPMVSVHRRGLR